MGEAGGRDVVPRSDSHFYYSTVGEAPGQVNAVSWGSHNSNNSLWFMVYTCIYF